MMIRNPALDWREERATENCHHEQRRHLAFQNSHAVEGEREDVRPANRGEQADAHDGMGVLKSQVSSLLVMAILGGALLPPIQGFIADHHGLQISFIVPLIAYAYVAFYGAIGHKIGRKEIAGA